MSAQRTRSPRNILQLLEEEVTTLLQLENFHQCFCSEASLIVMEKESYTVIT